MNRLQRAASILASILVAIATGTSFAQTYQVLENFEGTNGATPQYGVPLQASNGKLYAMTAFGGTINCSPEAGFGCGAIYELTTTGTFTDVYDFPGGTNGYVPIAGLVEMSGSLYGTTSVGGTGSCGTVFRTTFKGVETVLHNFIGTDGCMPLTTLSNPVKGELYGTTSAGGSGNGGTVFKINSAGKLITLHEFCQQSNCADGSNPNAPLVEGTDGNFYGTTLNGGALNLGSVFKLTPTGTFTLLYSFCSQFNCSDGMNPYAGLVQAADGYFYGMTSNGAANFDFGTVFRISAQGHLTTIHSFNGDDGFAPTGTLVVASDHNLYGTTQFGGTSRIGNIIRITTAGKVTQLYSFCSQQDCTDGSIALAGMVQDTDGNFYGQTAAGGPLPTTCPAGYTCGVVYRLLAGLPAFVKPWSMTGKVGALVTILGTNLKGATAVKFNGVAATFKVQGNSEITATVPAGAKTGYITVATPSGALSSNTPFHVQ